MDLHIILLLSKNVSYTFSPKPRSDVSKFLLIKDLLQFDSHKQPPLISEHQLFTFWVVTELWVVWPNYQPQKWKYKLQVMLQRTIREDNLEHKQFCNIVSNGCNTVLTLRCFVVLKIAIADQSMYPYNNSPLNLGRMLFKWIRYILFKHHLITSVKIL